MKNLDSLIKKFQDIKEELNKNMNMAYSPKPNSAGAPTPTPQTGMYRSEDVKKDGMIGQDAMAMSECLKFDNNGQWSLDKSAFKTLQHKIENEGHSKESAGAITAAIGRKEIGQKAMTARSKAGMDKVDPEETINIAHPKTKAKIIPMSHKSSGNNEDM